MLHVFWDISNIIHTNFSSAFTSAVWQANRDILEQDLVNKESFNSTLYYTAMKSHPWVPEHQRINEVWFPEVATEDE